MTVSPLSYWLASAPAFTGGARGAVEGKVDVAIIGGGFTGLSAALALARQGASVMLLEQGRVAGEASGRNGGQCNNGTAHDYGALSARFGKDIAKAYYRAHCDAVDLVERIVLEEGIDCAFRRCGRVKLAAKPQHYEKLVRAHDLLAAEVDENVRLVPPERMAEEVGSDAFHGALIQTTSAQLHPGRFAIGLAEAAARAGARIFEQAEVSGMDRLPGGWRVTTPKGKVTASQILVATGGAPAAAPFGFFRRRIVSVGSFVIATEPLDAALIARLLPHRRNYVTSKNIGNYFRLTADDRLIFGGRARFAISDPRSDMKSGRILIQTMGDIFPALKGVGVDHVWGGMVDLTADRLPRAGEQDGIFYSMGYSGHGVQMATYMGQAMARVMSGDTGANPWAGLDWPSVPGHFGKPWFLPFVGLWYKWQDMIH
ncbi:MULTISPECIES: NAD(P)/FAD-dependent oxidoreductase [unclassified Sphingobium]|uniref:NAD(P)/FAD-dependent oxidoreductase n=1 Tax=unclassified Sphingobium TaxID=2611147 RepID=UPI0007F44253|nr:MULTISPECIES: FAD-binding oxidoreductase [unclassified Sphingobium]OAN59400.1 FAD-dependent oxidoreductase [Sphingobium sp. TCM1]WIW90186.1 FAD-binding oxidoreductase [Sphingobium sp. V4]